MIEMVKLQIPDMGIKIKNRKEFEVSGPERPEQIVDKM